MKNFAYLTADSLSAASAALAGGQAVAKAAGTDLLDLLKERVIEPVEVVNLLKAKRGGPEGSISALTTLSELAEDARIAKEFPALHTAAEEAATPQIRNRGTVGGNLCQVSRCGYLRTRGFDCFKTEGKACAALLPGAHNRTHAIFDVAACACASPTSLGPALMALDAKLVLVKGEERRTVGAEDLYTPPAPKKISDTTLAAGELIEAVLIEPSPLTRNSVYREFRERQSFDFALVSVAAAVHVEGGKVKAARIACGAVAPTPRRMKAAEQALVGKPLNAESIAAAAAAAVKGARPLEQNGFKVTILERLMRRALKELEA